MAVEVRIPTLGESVTDGVIVRWIKGEGEAVAIDEALFELETDKASVEVPAEIAGVLHIVRAEGETVEVGDVVASIDPEGKASTAKAEPKAAAETSKAGSAASTDGESAEAAEADESGEEHVLSPAVRRLVAENDLDPKQIKGTGKGGRLTKGDVLAHLEAADDVPVKEKPQPAVAPAATPSSPTPAPKQRPAPASSSRALQSDVERVPMSRLRQRIAERLVQAQRTAAILTTFNEVDMTAVMALRKRYKEAFAEKHDVPLGFMSFFARACVAALQDFPLVNAQVDGTDIVYNRGIHLGVAVATERGLLVPVIHNAENLSFAGIESEIARLAGLARDSKLSIDDLSGGTFSISNGGVFGSLLSTPILNPPQSAILGMHKIEKRPVVVGDEIVVRPMMYLALSYDHRLVDGEQAVRFLVKVKERLEDPTRLLLEV